MKPLAPPLATALFALSLAAAPADFAAAGARSPERGAPASDSAQRLLLAATAGPSGAANAVAAPASLRAPWMSATLVLHGTAGDIRVSPPRVATAPQLDGTLDDEVWAQAAVLDSFTHSRPVEGVRDSLGTTCLVMYDDQNLYVGFQAKDDPRRVQGPIVPRDRIWQGDWVGVSIDTYNDRQRAFFLCANPHGIQMDGVDQEGADSDMAPDFLYTSKGHMTPEGYEVEMAIPFKTLRFIPGESVTFGFQAIRDIKRNGAHLYWAPVSRDINSYFTQIGSLQNLSGVRPGRNLEVNPTHTTSTLAERDASKLAWNEPLGRFGLGVKYGITSNLIADVTMTPDFSQVEADAGVVDVNERFALFFPEKRPFFLEGSDIFSSPINLVYTRRIANPLYGAKLTGKVGHTTIGVLNASDRSAGEGFTGLPNDVNPYADRDAIYTIARVRQDVLKNSYVGVLLGDRTQRDQFNRGAGFDGRLRWRDQYSLSFQGAQSWSGDKDFSGALSQLSPAQQAGVDPALYAQTGQRRTGEAWYADLRRDTRKLNARVTALGISPDFTADMGFINRTDQVDLQAQLVPHIRGGEKDWFTDIRPILYAGRTYNYAGTHTTDDVVSFIFEGDLPNATWAGTENNRRTTVLGTTVFTDIYRHAVWLGSDRWQAIRPNGVFVWGDQVVYAEAVRGRDMRWEANADLRFNSQFDASITTTGRTVWRDNGTRYAHAFIPRARVSYQFSRELSVRLITELRQRKLYDSNGVLTEKSNSVTPDLLLSYYVRPGTVVYLGYGSELSGRDADNIAPLRSSVFTKVSYLWQM